MQPSMMIARHMRRQPLENTWSSTLLLNATLSVRNYRVDESTGLNAAAMSRYGLGSGRHYAEFQVNAAGAFDCAVGLRLESESISTAVNAGQTMVMRAGAQVYAGSTGASTGTGATFVSNQRLMMAVDFEASKLWIGVAGTWVNSGNPAAGTGALFSGFPAGIWHQYWWADNNPAGSHFCGLYNGQNGDSLDFIYTPPDGFAAGFRY